MILVNDPQKRLVADVAPDYFWDVKAEVSKHKLKMREFLPLAAAYLLGLDHKYNPQTLGLDDDAARKVKTLLENMNTKEDAL